MFGHWLQILFLLGLALLVFGPKRVIEMGSAAGKAWKEFRESTKDINLANLLNTEEAEPRTPPTVTPFPSGTASSGASSGTPSGTSSGTPSSTPSATSSTEPTVVEGTVERREAAGE